MNARYHLEAGGNISADGNPLELLPPTQIVKEAATHLERSSHILDVGAYIGVNGFYLSGLGHRVDSVEQNQSYIDDGEILAERIGAKAQGNHFIRADIRSYEPPSIYNAAIATKVLQDLPKPETYQAIDKLKRAVVPDGLNVLMAYIASHEQQAEVPHLTLFEPGELQALYEQNGWQILTYRERMKPLRQFRNPLNYQTEVRVASSAELIARKKRGPSLSAVYSSYSATIRNINPEYADYLAEQSN